ncbi:hypothetical protein KRP22_004290 [Phytophthora ramorum]|nr:hypothetical protein KRP22_13393 [Phytophthora ramorum]
MQQLWQEYAARSHAANRQVDAATYHEKMHRRYGEQRALKERVAQLEQALRAMERERNEARVQTENATKQLALLALDRSTTELSEATAASPTMRTVRSSIIRPTAAETQRTRKSGRYKNGHLVLAETSGPDAATRLPREQLAAQQEQQRTHEVTVYRGTRYLPLAGACDDDAVLAELDVIEAFSAATSQVWWLEVRAVLLGCEGNCDSESLTAKVDLRRLLTFCATFASYRPSESHAGGNNDDAELFAVHEALLEPLFDSLRVVLSEVGGTATLEVVAEVEVDHQLEPSRRTGDEGFPSTLTHQCVVNVGDVFYCVRLQELWDGELLLDITMDDPETQQRFHVCCTSRSWQN